jgi:hypothetical protein
MVERLLVVCRLLVISLEHRNLISLQGDEGMSEEANTRLGDDKESGLLLSVESMQGGERRASQRVDGTDTDTDSTDSGDALSDADGTDESDGDETDTLGDTDSTDAGGDSDGTDSGDSDGSDS